MTAIGMMAYRTNNMMIFLTIWSNTTKSRHTKTLGPTKRKVFNSQEQRYGRLRESGIDNIGERMTGSPHATRLSPERMVIANHVEVKTTYMYTTENTIEFSESIQTI